MIGVVAEGSDVAAESLGPGDRLAFIEVIAGLRFDHVPTHIEVVAGDLAGWGYPLYIEGQHVFLRIEDGVDIDTGVPDGPCSWQQRLTEEQTNDLLALAEAHGVPIVFPMADIAQPEPDPPPTPPPTSAPEDTAVEDAPAVDTESAAPANPGPPSDGDSKTSSTLLIAAGMVGLAGFAASGYFVVKSRS